MASSLPTNGKIYAMNGIRNVINAISLYSDDSGTAIAVSYNVDNNSFSVNASTGEFTNTEEISFTIGSEDIGKVADYVVLSGSGGSLLNIDLITPKLLNLDGVATIAIGALSASL